MIDAIQHRMSLPTQQVPDPMRQAALELETTFLAEMLKTAGFGKPVEAFGGGAGEEHFSSFLVQAQAEAMVQAGGIGLSETFYKVLMEKEHV